MANGQPTSVRIADAIQIRLIVLILNSRKDADALAQLIASLASSGQLPPEFEIIARHAADTLADLDERLRVFLESQGAADAS